MRKEGVLATLRRIGQDVVSALLGTVLRSAVNGKPWAVAANRKWPVRAIAEDTTYVFVFLGEFGYEVLNWQGVVRKFASSLPASSAIAIAGRSGLDPFYETAAQYVDISDFELYRKSVAASYFAIPPDMERRCFPPSARELSFDLELRSQLRKYVGERLRGKKESLQFIFSSHLTPFPGCIFGVDRKYYGYWKHPGSIYDGFDFLTSNNHYASICMRSDRSSPEVCLPGLNLREPYILVQKRTRQIGPQYGQPLNEGPLIAELSRHVPVVLLSFDTGRNLDSRSDPTGEGPNCYHYYTRTFLEQRSLIMNAYRCVFVTEGDLGSHTYLPPLMGKDVYVLGSREIFQKPSAPIEGWNKTIFRFDGQMIPLVAETVLRSPDSIRATAAHIRRGRSPSRSSDLICTNLFR